jgi:hypothetical protein
MMSNTNPIFQRYHHAYLEMAPFYRPGAPSDGFGHIQLSADQCHNRQRLEHEANEYTAGFLAEEEKRTFNIGCADYRTARAFLWVIEAARQLASGDGGNATALRLLKMAAKEIKAS